MNTMRFLTVDGVHPTAARWTCRLGQKSYLVAVGYGTTRIQRKERVLSSGIEACGRKTVRVLRVCALVLPLELDASITSTSLYEIRKSHDFT